jgi:hypothetical protein
VGRTPFSCSGGPVIPKVTLPDGVFRVFLSPFEQILDNILN